MTAYTEADVERVARALCYEDRIISTSMLAISGEGSGVPVQMSVGKLIFLHAGNEPVPVWMFYRQRAARVLDELSARPIGWTPEDDPAPAAEDPPAPKDLTEAWRLGCGLV